MGVSRPGLVPGVPVERELVGVDAVDEDPGGDLLGRDVVETNLVDLALLEVDERQALSSSLAGRPWVGRVEPSPSGPARISTL